jgi:hypothetical protein
VDLQSVYLASCVSGKGLGAFPGLSMVFYHDAVAPEPDKLPRYLDLGYYAAQNGVPFTHSSNLLSALQEALKRYDSQQPFAEIEELSVWLLQIRELFHILAPDAHRRQSSLVRSVDQLGNRRPTVGRCFPSAPSEYRGSKLVQICLMGECSRRRLSSRC